jgi:hypothetical protein
LFQTGQIFFELQGLSSSFVSFFQHPSVSKTSTMATKEKKVEATGEAPPVQLGQVRFQKMRR